MDATTIVSFATPIVVPLIIAGVKWVIPKIPTWLIPMLAPVLGGLVGVISNYATTVDTNVWLVAALGLAGVGVREIVDQLKIAKDPKD